MRHARVLIARFSPGPDSRLGVVQTFTYTIRLQKWMPIMQKVSLSDRPSRALRTWAKINDQTSPEAAVQPSNLERHQVPAIMAWQH